MKGASDAGYASYQTLWFAAAEATTSRRRRPHGFSTSRYIVALIFIATYTANLTSLYTTGRGPYRKHL